MAARSAEFLSCCGGPAATAAYAGAVSTPFDQSRYQIRFEWGVDGFHRLAASDIVVVVDVLRFSSTVTDRVAAGERVPLDAAAHAGSLNGARVAAHAAAAAHAPVVFLGCLRNASAVAREVLAEQTRRAARTSVAVIAAGELTGRGPGAPLRFAVEDLLGAGAVIDAIGTLGLDHTSPEAAAACEAHRGLARATRHLLTSSGSGQELLASAAAAGDAARARGAAAGDAARARAAAAGDEAHVRAAGDEARAAAAGDEAHARAEVLATAELDAVASVPVLRDGAFVAA